MAKSLNFNTIKKEYFTVTLPDEEKTTIMITTPTKALLRELMSIAQNANVDYEDENAVESIFDDLYNVISKVMSRNKGGVHISKEKLEECLDFENIMLFFKSYLGFVNGFKNSKN